MFFSAHSQWMGCQANFCYVQNGPSIVFTDFSSISPFWSSNYSVSWEWSFGDGTPVSTQQNPVHTYVNNGIYNPCLTVMYFDSLIMNTCISTYCDSIFISQNSSYQPTWDCDPITGCYDPLTGLGQYCSLASCDTMCGAAIPTWDCPVNTPGGCYDPGTGLGQYPSLSSCQAVCGVPILSWDCGSNGCYDPGTGIGQYTSLAACQAVCVGMVSNLCDSMTASGSQFQITMAINNVNTIIDYWVTTSNDGTLLQEDSMISTHTIFNYPQSGLGQAYDTLNTCIAYYSMGTTNTCCVTWVWDSVSGFWAKMGNLTSLTELTSFDKKLIKVVDIFGRETPVNSKQILFYIYDDGKVEKRMIIE